MKVLDALIQLRRALEREGRSDEAPARLYPESYNLYDIVNAAIEDEQG